jgi:hypothetical protein
MLIADAVKFQEFIENNAENDELIRELKKYIKIKFLLEGKKVKNVEKVQVVKHKIEYDYEQGIRESIEDWGIERVIAAVGLEKVIAAVGFNTLIEFLKKNLSEKEINDIITILKSKT